jgi:hypothetical protein
VERTQRAHRNERGQHRLHTVEHAGSFGDSPMGIHWTGIVLGWAESSPLATGQRTSWLCNAC